MHPCCISLVYVDIGSFSLDAHFLMLSPSMFGMLLTAIPYIMPVREVVMLRVSSSGLLGISSCTGGGGSSIPVFVSVILILLFVFSGFLYVVCLSVVSCRSWCHIGFEVFARMPFVVVLASLFDSHLDSWVLAIAYGFRSRMGPGVLLSYVL